MKQRWKMILVFNPFSGIKKIVNRFLKIDGDPRKIALGFALGSFLGLTPLVGFQAVIAVFTASLLRWNRLAAGIGVFNTNILTGPFLYGISYLIGSTILGITTKFSYPGQFNLNFIYDLFTKSSEILLALSVGGLILGIPIAFFAYFLSYSAVKKYRIIASKRKNL